MRRAWTAIRLGALAFLFGLAGATLAWQLRDDFGWRMVGTPPEPRFDFEGRHGPEFGASGARMGDEPLDHETINGLTENERMEDQRRESETEAAFSVMPLAEGSDYLGHAILEPMPASATRGNITFAVSSGALVAMAVVEGAPPGRRALVIHEGTACRDGAILMDLGEHLNPFDRSHGAPNAEEQPHLGDLGNIDISPEGRGELLLYLHDAAYSEELRGGWPIILGHVVALHERPDDFITQPDGNVGQALACGVIVRQEGGPH